MTVDRGDQHRAGLVAGAVLIDVGAGGDERLDRVGVAAARGEDQRAVAALRADQFVVEEGTIDAGLAAAATRPPPPPPPAHLRSLRTLRTLRARSHNLSIAARSIAACLVAAARRRREEFLLGAAQVADVVHLRSRLDVRAGLDERLDRINAIHRCGKHQRRLAEGLFLGFDLGAVLDERRHRLRIARLRREHQRRRAQRVRGLRVGAAGKERRNHRRVALVGGHHQRRVTAQARRRLHVRAGEEQHLRRARRRRFAPPSGAPSCRRPAPR